MEAQTFNIEGPKLVKTKLFRDERGFFSETYSRTAFGAIGIAESFVQDNHSLSASAGTVRGLHLQVAPHAQGKLVRVAKGAIFDVAVDLREDSSTFGQHISATLSAENWLQLWVPVGFAHGFCTLEPDTEVIYKVTAEYRSEAERGIRWDDPDLGIGWPVSGRGAILSPKDWGNQKLANHPFYF